MSSSDAPVFTDGGGSSNDPLTNNSHLFSWGDHVYHEAAGGKRYPYSSTRVQYEDSTRTPGTVHAAYGMVDMSVQVDNNRVRPVLRASNFYDPTSRLPLHAFTLPSVKNKDGARDPVTLMDLLRDKNLLRELGADMEIHKDGLLDMNADTEGALVTGGVMLMDPADAGNRYDISMCQYSSGEGSLLVIAATADGTTVDFHESGKTSLVRFKMEDGTLGRWKVERFDQTTAEGRKAAFEGMHPSSEAFIVSVPVEEVGKPKPPRSRGSDWGNLSFVKESCWIPNEIMKSAPQAMEEEEEGDEEMFCFDDEEMFCLDVDEAFCLDGPAPPMDVNMDLEVNVEPDVDMDMRGVAFKKKKSKEKKPKTVLDEHGFEFLKHTLESTGDPFVPSKAPYPLRRIKDSMIRIVHRIPAAYDTSRTPSRAVLENIQKRVTSVHRDKPLLEIFGHVARMQEMQKQGRLVGITAGVGQVAAQAAQDGLVCVICCEDPLSAVGTPCGHMLACGTCAMGLDGKACPFCRCFPCGIISESEAARGHIKVIAQGFKL
jgi:hypothetical protein